MPAILHLSKSMTAEPLWSPCQGITLLTFEDRQDVDSWLLLRQRAFAEERPPVGPWSVADFEREFLRQAWWQPRQMWLAVDSLQSSKPLVGSVTLLLRDKRSPVRAALHWLMVDPAYRQRGLGRMLTCAGESTAWRAGMRQVFVETHSAWSAAAFYQRLGYRNWTAESAAQ